MHGPLNVKYRVLSTTTKTISNAMGLTQPLTEMSTKNISWGVRRVGLTTLPPSCADNLEMWEPHPPATLRDCPGL